MRDRGMAAVRASVAAMGVPLGYVAGSMSTGRRAAGPCAVYAAAAPVHAAIRVGESKSESGLPPTCTTLSQLFTLPRLRLLHITTLTREHHACTMSAASSRSSSNASSTIRQLLFRARPAPPRGTPTPSSLRSRLTRRWNSTSTSASSSPGPNGASPTPLRKGRFARAVDEMKKRPCVYLSAQRAV